MNDRMIALHDLAIGMKTKYDIQDDYGRCLVERNTELGEEEMKRLTSTGTAYFIYENLLDENEDPEPEANTGLTRLLSDVSVRTKEDLEIILQGASVEEDIYLFHEEMFSSLKERSGIIIEKITSEFFNNMEDGSFYVHQFYWRVKDFLKEYSPTALKTFQQVFVPYPTGGVVTLEGGVDCIVVDLDQHDPENPVLRMLLSEDEDVFLLKEQDKKIISADPVSYTVDLFEDDENQERS